MNFTPNTLLLCRVPSHGIASRIQQWGGEKTNDDESPPQRV